MKRHRRRSDRSGRAPLSSPGRPSAAGRDERRRFWAAIAAGMASEDAAVEAGVSQAVGTRWFRKAGGMPPSMFGLSAKPLPGRYLSFADREEIALLRAQGYSMQKVARRLGRAVSTISRELRSNAATRSGGLEYRAKSVFQVHGVDEAGAVLIRKRVSRAKMQEFLANLKPCLVGIEACPAAHHWGRELQALGHAVKLMRRTGDLVPRACRHDGAPCP
jgi:transposase-like protein